MPGTFTPFRSESSPPTATRVSAKSRAVRGHREPEPPVVNEQGGAGDEHREELRVRKLHPSGIARPVGEIEPKGLAGLHLHGPVPAERPEPELRPLEIEENPDRAALLLLHGPDDLHPPLVVLGLSVTEVEPEEVRSGPEQGCDDLALIACRPQSGHDLGLARTPHGSLPAEPARSGPREPYGFRAGITIARKSLTLVKVGPVSTSPPSAAKNP